MEPKIKVLVDGEVVGTLTALVPSEREIPQLHPLNAEGYNVPEKSQAAFALDAGDLVVPVESGFQTLVVYDHEDHPPEVRPFIRSLEESRIGVWRPSGERIRGRTQDVIMVDYAKMALHGNSNGTDIRIVVPPGDYRTPEQWVGPALSYHPNPPAGPNRAQRRAEMRKKRGRSK